MPSPSTPSAELQQSAEGSAPAAAPAPTGVLQGGLATLRWLGSALTQPQPAELAALPQPEARADRAALLSLTAINLVVLLLALALARPHAPRHTPPPAVPTARASAEAA